LCNSLERVSNSFSVSSSGSINSDSHPKEFSGSVGESPYAAKLGVTADRLEHGAYRIASGEKWLALIGDDTDFTPKGPWAKNNSGRGAKLQGEWEKASGLPFAACSQIDAR
jgi:hypothetical protein